MFSVIDFGATGDGVTDDSDAIQHAIDVAQTVTTGPAVGGTVFLPGGAYSLNTGLTIDPAKQPIRMLGEGYRASVLKAGKAMDSLLALGSKAKDCSQLSLEHFGLDGNGEAAYGIYGARVNHVLLHRLRVIQTTAAAISIGYGWCNTLDACETSNNSGDGIRLNNDYSESNNDVTILNCKVFLNGQFGLRILSGLSVRVIGNTFEANRCGGIYAQYQVAALLIQGNYFESNSQNGVAFSSPATTVRADVILNGSNTPHAWSAAYPSRAVTVSGNFTSSADTSAQEFIRAIGVRGLIVESNSAGHVAVPLIKTPGSASHGSVSQVRIGKANVGFSKNVVPTHITNYSPDAFATWTDETLPTRNYIHDDVLQFTLKSQVGGTLSRSPDSFNGHPVFDIHGVRGQSSAWRNSIQEIAHFPDLAGQLVLMGCFVRNSAGGMNGVLGVNGGESTNAFSNSTLWRWSEVVQVLPSSGPVDFYFYKIGGEVADRVSFACPVVCPVGTDVGRSYDHDPRREWRASMPPTIGSWQAGDRVIQALPAVGRPTGWRCIASGTPGQWATEARL